MLRKLWCKHKFQLLTTYETDIDNGVGYDKRTKYIVYCPKCKKQMNLLQYEYNALIEKQKVDEIYEEAKREEFNRKYRE